MTQDLRIAFLQLLPGKNQEENLQIGLKACREAKEHGADIALFPEMWNVGYQIPEDPERMARLSVDADGSFVKTFGNAALELDMAIGTTFLEKWNQNFRNSIRLYDRHGKTVFTYAKVHTCDFGDEARLYPGNSFFCSTLDTKKGPVQVGAMICYDREFPESSRILMLQGAELILIPNACPMEINRLCQLRARAFENMLAVATCNYPAPHPDCNGHSSLFDGIAYKPDVEGSCDTCLLEAGEEPGIYYGDLSLEDLRAYRSEEVHGNAYRRPWLYGALTEETICEPFIRADYRGKQEV